MNDEGLAEFEMAQLGNLCPETADEAKSLIPRYPRGVCPAGPNRVAAWWGRRRTTTCRGC